VRHTRRGARRPLTRTARPGRGSTHADPEAKRKPPSREPRADQSPDRSRQRTDHTFRRLVEDDGLFERGDAPLICLVFRRQGSEHGFDVTLPFPAWGGDELVWRERISRAAIDEARARAAPDRGVEPVNMIPGDAGADPRGEPPGRLPGNSGSASAVGKVPAEAASSVRVGLRATGESFFGAVGQVPALRRARRSR
jgi:hypothetical protein